MLSDIDSVTNIVTCITAHVQVVKFLYSVSFSAS